MSERPKRAISKPSRYVTTSSDDAPTKPKRVATTTSAVEVQQDIQDIRMSLEEEATIHPNYDNNNNNNYVTNYTLHTHAQSEKTNIQSRINPSNTNIHSPVISQLDHTNFQSFNQHDTIDQAHTHSQSYTITNVQPSYSLSHNNYGSQTSQSLTQNYTTQHVEKVTNYTHNPLIEFQDHRGNSGTHKDIPSQNYNIGIAASTAHAYNHHQHQPAQTENSDIRKIYERLQIIEAKMKRFNSTADKILRCVQDRHRAPRKPAIFPIASLSDMDAFEGIDEDGYSNAINYFHYIGGYNLREAVNISLKESLKDAIASSFTWWGREGHRPLYNTHLVMAIYDGVCQNRHFEKPTRSEFQMQMREALRMSKERHRSRLRKKTVSHERSTRIQQDLWNDERSNDTHEESADD